LTYKNAGDAKTKHKQTRIKFFRNLTPPKDNTANEINKILETQLARSFAKRKHANFENLQNRS